MTSDLAPSPPSKPKHLLPVKFCFLNIFTQGEVWESDPHRSPRSLSSSQLYTVGAQGFSLQSPGSDPKVSKTQVSESPHTSIWPKLPLTPPFSTSWLSKFFMGQVSGARVPRLLWLQPRTSVALSLAPSKSQGDLSEKAEERLKGPSSRAVEHLPSMLRGSEHQGSDPSTSKANKQKPPSMSP